MRKLAIIAIIAIIAAPLQLNAQGAPRGAAAQTVAKPDSTPRPMHSSWTSDRAMLGVGDVVTVLIQERTLASANLKENHSDRRDKNLGLSVQPPAAPGMPTTSTTANMAFGNDGASQRSGQASRDNSFSSEMSVRVVAVSPTGMIQIQGRKMVVVDKSKQEVVLTGWIRPQDVAVGTNTVPSWRIADAEIAYGQQGSLGKPKSGMLTKLLSAIWP